MDAVLAEIATGHRTNTSGMVTDMAILHQATLSPSKAELLSAYLPHVDGLGVGGHDDLALVGAYRFDDPAGDVGIETHLIATPDGRVIQMPLTYRAAPLDGAEDWLITTLEHSALGTRWVYDGCGDPVYVSELVRTIIEGDTQVELEVLTPDGTIERDNTVFVQGSGSDEAAPAITSVVTSRSGTTSTIAEADLSVVVHHVLTPGPAPESPHLAGTWKGVDKAHTMATLSS